MAPASACSRPLVFVTGPPSARGFGINTHIRMLQSTGLAQAYRLEVVDLGGETWRASGPGRVVRLLSQLVRFRRALSARRPALVHFNSAPDAKAFLRDAAALWTVPRRIATVFEFHGGFERNTVLQGPAWFRRYAELTLRRASAVVVLAPYHEERLLGLCPGLTNVRVVPNFLEPEAMSALLAAERVPGGDTFRLLFIGRVTREKGVLDAIEAMRLLRDRGTTAALTVVGSGEDLGAARALVARRGLEGTVRFTGFAGGEDKIAAYRSSDALVFPTRWNEGFPYVLLEAMAAGLPIVSTTHGVMPHLLRDGVNGFLVGPRDPAALAERIERLAKDPTLRAAVGNANRREVQASYGIGEATRAYGELYAGVLRGRTDEAADLGLDRLRS